MIVKDHYQILIKRIPNFLSGIDHNPFLNLLHRLTPQELIEGQSRQNKAHPHRLFIPFELGRDIEIEVYNSPTQILHGMFIQTQLIGL